MFCVPLTDLCSALINTENSMINKVGFEVQSVVWDPFRKEVAFDICIYIILNVVTSTATKEEERKDFAMWFSL